MTLLARGCGRFWREKWLRADVESFLGAEKSFNESRLDSASVSAELRRGRGGFILNYNALMDYDPPTEDVILLHRVMGMGVLKGRELLRALPAAHRAKLLLAVRTQGNAVIFHDPLEDDPIHGRTIAAVGAEASRLMEEEVDRRNEEWQRQGMGHMSFLNNRGRCHVLWKHKKRLLKERHGLDWLSPAEMNPGAHFD